MSGVSHKVGGNIVNKKICISKPFLCRGGLSQTLLVNIFWLPEKYSTRHTNVYRLITNQ